MLWKIKIRFLPYFWHTFFYSTFSFSRIPVKSLSAIRLHQKVMNPHSGINDNNKKETTKAISAAIPIAGMLVAAALLSGLSMIGNYQPAIAQNMTAGGNATATTPPPTTAGTGNATGSACDPSQIGGANMTTTAGGANMTTTAGGANMTTTGSPTQLIEQACMAALNDDTQGVLMNLNAALNVLSANATTTTTADDDAEDDDGEDEEE